MYTWQISSSVSTLQLCETTRAVIFSNQVVSCSTLRFMLPGLRDCLLARWIDCNVIASRPLWLASNLLPCDFDIIYLHVSCMHDILVLP